MSAIILELLFKSHSGLVLGEVNQLLIAFSVFTNAKELFSTSRNESAVAYLSGLKALSSIGIVFLHSITCRLLFPLRDPNDAVNFLKSPLASIVNGFYFNVDTFLLISGMLITKSTLKALDE